MKAALKAEQAQGRIIHMSFDITLIPPGHPVEWEKLGDTDEAREIGKGLIREAMLMLQNTCKAEGFTVEVEARQVIY